MDFAMSNICSIFMSEPIRTSKSKLSLLKFKKNLIKLKLN